MLFPPMHPQELYTENFNRHVQMFPEEKEQEDHFRNLISELGPVEHWTFTAGGLIAD